MPLPWPCPSLSPSAPSARQGQKGRHCRAGPSREVWVGSRGRMPTHSPRKCRWGAALLSRSPSPPRSTASVRWCLFSLSLMAGLGGQRQRVVPFIDEESETVKILSSFIKCSRHPFHAPHRTESLSACTGHISIGSPEAFGLIRSVLLQSSCPVLHARCVPSTAGGLLHGLLKNRRGSVHCLPF